MPAGGAGSRRVAVEVSSNTDLETLVDALGDVLLRVAVAPSGVKTNVVDVVIYDPHDVEVIASGSVVLGVGIRGASSIATLLDELGRAGATALCVKVDRALEPHVRESAEASGVAVLAVPSGVSWTHLAALMRSLISARAFALQSDEGEAAGTDLFSFADAVADMIGGPITIEDELLRVLAFSAEQGDMDIGRRETILGRRVPERWVETLRQHDILRSVYASRGPVYFEIDGIRPRLGIAVRAGEELFGSMWAVVDGPVDDDRQRRFGEAAAMAALYLLRERSAAHAAHRADANVLLGLLFGRGGEAEAVERLGLTGRRVRVLAVQPVGRKPAERRLERHWNALDLYLSSYRVLGATAISGEVLYAAIAVDADDRLSLRRARELTTDYALRGHAVRTPSVRIGIGGATDAVGTERSRREADEALAVVARHERRGPVAAIDDVLPIALLHRFVDGLRHEDLECFVLRQLAEHDLAHQTTYVETLGAYLAARGDAAVASERLHVHPNTVRYRLRKLQELSDVQLDDPEEWLGLSLLLAARELRS